MIRTNDIARVYRTREVLNKTNEFGRTNFFSSACRLNEVPAKTAPCNATNCGAQINCLHHDRVMFLVLNHMFAQLIELIFNVNRMVSD